VLYSQGVLVLADRYSQICGFSASNGSQLWCVPEQANSNGNGQTIGSYLAGPDQLYVAFLNQQFGASSQQSLQVKALDYRTGQATWTSASLSYSRLISGFIPLDLVQLQQNTLLIGDGSPQVVALDTTSGHTLWQINGPTPKNQVLKIAATNE
jgi:outer membrane protein assembly factor BamB